MRAKRDDADELLLELVSHPGWRVAVAEMDEMAQSIVNQMMQPSEGLMDLLKREAEAAKLVALRQVRARIENRANAYARKQADRN